MAANFMQEKAMECTLLSFKAIKSSKFMTFELLNFIKYSKMSSSLYKVVQRPNIKPGFKFSIHILAKCDQILQKASMETSTF